MEYEIDKELDREGRVVFRTKQGAIKRPIESSCYVGEDMKSQLGVKIEKIKREDGTVFLSTEYMGQQCPFCGSKNYGGGGSWAPDGCLDCGALNFMGWVKELAI